MDLIQNGYEAGTLELPLGSMSNNPTQPLKKLRQVRACCFGCFKVSSGTVLHGIEAVMVLTLDNSEIASQVQSILWVVEVLKRALGSV